MNKKVKAITILIIVTSLICSFIVSQNNHHIDTCKDEHCEICNIIHVAQQIINLIVTMFVCFYTSILIQYVLSKIHKVQKIFIQKTLVFQKVQMNE